MKGKPVFGALAVILSSMLAGSVFAQRPPEPDKILVKVLVVLSRSEGDRKSSSLPFTLLATANGDRASVRAGGRFAIEQSTSSPPANRGADDKGPSTSY